MQRERNERLDHYLVRNGWFRSRDRAKQAIVSGKISLNGTPVRKPAAEIGPDDLLHVAGGDFPYVSRAALKLEAALDSFAVDPRGLTVLDIGVATGGFSQLLLEKGAARVYGVDVGRGQIAQQLLQNPRFVFRNQTDARSLRREDFPELPDLIVVDVSFLSIEALLPALARLAGPATRMIVLIKPQYEMGPGQRRNFAEGDLRRRLSAIRASFVLAGLAVQKELPSPLKGKEGTQEYLWLSGPRVS